MDDIIQTRDKNFKKLAKKQANAMKWQLIEPFPVCLHDYLSRLTEVERSF